jgi:cell wall-associated NlpC family hydrolase
MTGIQSPVALAQLQSLLALQTALSSRASADAGAGASGVDFAGVLQALATGAAGPGAAGTASGPTGADVVADARKYMGVPYVFGGTTSTGMDCSGLVQTVFKDLGVTDVARGVHGQMVQGQPVASLADAQPGDLIVFKGGGHIAIYAGDGKVIHAPYPGRTVSEQKLWTDDSGIETIRRMVPSGSSTAAPSPVDAGAASAQSAAFLLGLALGSESGGFVGAGGVGSGGVAVSDPALIAQLITARTALAAQMQAGGLA